MLPILLPTPYPASLFFLGPPLEEGPLPAFFYFALSAEESLVLPPYNNPISFLVGEKIRLFSFTIPAHGAGFDKFKAMDVWMEWALSGNDFLNSFFDATVATIDWLIENNTVDKHSIAVGGLSRGGFIATHIAARQKDVKLLLGFAPLTTLTTISEFQNQKDLSFLEKMEEFDLKKQCANLLHLQSFRFYIGNRDLRVSTDACYFLVRALADVAYEKKARHLSIELRINSSIGAQGHGTSETIFKEGALWVKEQLIR